MNTVIKYILILAVFCGTIPSCNYLEVVPDNVATIDYAFRNRTACEKFLFTCYSYLPKHGETWCDPAMVATDEGWYLSQNVKWAGRNIAMGLQNVSNPYLNAWSGTDGLPALWDGIRDCNIFLENVENVHDLTPVEKKKWIGEVKFLKAYFHFYLLCMYGPIPIMDQNIPVSASPGEVKVYREPVDDVFNYIADLMEEAAQDLPDEREVIVGTEAGHINNLIAKSIRAKVLVYAASSLFNGNTDYASLVDNRGVQLFPQSFDIEKWKKAADACKEAIDMCHEQGKKLYDVVDPQLSNVNDTFKIQTTYRQAICDRWNSELIWGGTGYNCSALSSQAQARILRLSAEVAGLVVTEWGPTLKIIEKYYSANGVPIREDKEWVNNNWYDRRYEIRQAPSSGKEKYYVKEGEKTVYLHYNREPRFYASIGFDRGIYFGNGYIKFPDDVKSADFLLKGISGKYAAYGFSITGYCAKKMHSYKNAQTTSAISVEYFPFPIIRLADLYLLYAEALNEYSGPVDEALKYINMVRERVHLENVQSAWKKYSTNPEKPSTKNGLRDIIRQERTIELAFEGERFWDIRRWKQIQELNDQPMGWNTTRGETLETFYVKTPASPTHIQFSVRDYFWPIKETEITINRNLVQNFDW